jgi:hypothetical protein
MGFFKKRRNDINDVKKKRRLASAFSDTYVRIISSGHALQIAC